MRYMRIASTHTSRYVGDPVLVPDIRWLVNASLSLRLNLA